MPKTTNTHHEGVPLNVWLVSAAHGDGSEFRHRLAALLVDAYSPRGGVVVDLIPGRNEVLAAAASAGRGALALPTGCAARGRRRSQIGADLASAAHLAIALPDAARLGGAHRMIPRTDRCAHAAHAVRVLRPGGFLAVASVPAPRVGRDPLTATVEAAASHGLAYFQHVVALLGDEATAHVDVLVFERKAA